MGWFEYIYEIDWQEDGVPYIAPFDIDTLKAYGIEADLDKQAWKEWLSKWRSHAAQSRKDIFTKRNQRFLYFIDGRKKIYSKVLLKGGVVGVFVEVLAGTVEWSLQRGIQVMFDTGSPPRGRRYFIVVDDIKENVDEELPDKIVLLPGEMEFQVVYIDGEEHIDDTILQLMVELEKEEIKDIANKVAGDDVAIIWDGSLMALGEEYIYSNVPLVGFNRYMAMRYMPRDVESIYDILYDLDVAERTPLFGITGFHEHLSLVSSYIRLIKPEEEQPATIRGIALFETLHNSDNIPATLTELYDFLALMLPRLSTSAPFGQGTETLFPLLAAQGNLVHYFIPREYVAYLITKEVMNTRQKKD
ncbi:hypothetical protein GM182_01440 [bacterium 3DAC]|nr:hypothetical protein GM182_01440 [bacterium 3DAC]